MKRALPVPERVVSRPNSTALPFRAARLACGLTCAVLSLTPAWSAPSAPSGRLDATSAGAVSVAPPASNASSVAVKTHGPWGDVDEDGAVTLADAQMVQDFIASPTTYGTPAQRERILRYGDVAGVVNGTEIGNGVVNGQDLLRHARLNGGLIDSGVAGTTGSVYGDVDGDGKVTIADTVLISRAMAGKVTDPAVLARINARGGGDISPTIGNVTFGDGVIDANDVAVITARATGTEVTPPAYEDYWPMHFTGGKQPDVRPDRYTFNDLNKMSGDLMYQTTYVTNGVKEIDGYSVVEFAGTDGSLAGVYKDSEGSVYALYIQYPIAFNNHRVDFAQPIKVLDANAVTTVGATWKGQTIGKTGEFGDRPTRYTGTVLSVTDTYTSAAGAFPSGAPKSTWSKTVRIRLDVALYAIPSSTFDMQQAFFFDFMSGIGMVRRGQAAIMGSPAPTNDRPYLELDSARVRNILYNKNVPQVP